MRRRMDGDLKTRFQAPKRVGPPIKNQGSSRVDRLQAVGYYKIMRRRRKLYLLDYFTKPDSELSKYYINKCRKILCSKKKPIK